MTGDEIVETGRSLASCRLLVNHKHGVGGRVETKHGVPDLDKMAAFRRAQDVLAPWGFRPWEGLAEIPTGKRAMKDRNQKWRDRDEDEDRRDAFERWQEEAKADIAACYDGDHHIVVAYHPSCYGDAERAKALLGELLADHVRAQLIPIPSDVHGPRATLPRPALKAPRARDYAALRTEAWGPFIAEVRRYQDDIAARLDGILVIAPEWYRYNGSQAHDDLVNKRAGRIALARELRVPVQYLRPEEEDGQRFGAGQDLAKKFETRSPRARRSHADTLGYRGSRRALRPRWSKWPAPAPGWSPGPQPAA
jgi:hypothetical protein